MERKYAIITAAGCSTRFSKSIGFECHKSLMPVGGLNCKSLLEWQIKTLIDNGVDQVFAVGGYMWKIFNSQINKLELKYKEKVRAVFNSEYLTTGSYMSMFLGFDKMYHLIKSDTILEPTSIICVEGDVYASNFAEFVAKPFDYNYSIRPTTNGKSVLRADRDVIGIIDDHGFLSWKYSTKHSEFTNIPSSIKILFNSGQIWEICLKGFNLRKIHERLDQQSYKNDTNLTFIDYFSDKPDTPFELKGWVNANTVDEIKTINNQNK